MMPQDWHDADVARRWDASGDHRNPMRAEQLDILMSVLQHTLPAAVDSSIASKAWVLDLGFGSGKVEALLFERISKVKVVGVDASDAMMAIARERLAQYSEQFVPVTGDLADLHSLVLPQRPFQAVMAIQSLHHLSKVEMQDAYGWIFDVLAPGGVFLLLDRIRVENECLFPLLQVLWRRQDRVYGSSVAEHEGEDFTSHERKVLDRGDHPVLLKEHLAWLEAVGFHTACLHLHGNRALIAGVK